jgi:hypothetical protein
MGIVDYFDDNWNKFDFILVVLSLFLNITMSVLRVTKNLVASRGIRFIRFGKSQRCLRVCKWIQNNRISKAVFRTVNILQRIKVIVIKAVTCFTSFRRIASVMFITFYVYAVVGTQILYYSDEEYNEKSKNDPNLAYYEGNTYGNFSTFELSMFALFQILTESSWHMIVLYSELFKGFWLSCIFLLPFHMFITFIMRSILLGLTWEVFAIVSETDDYLVKSIKVDKEFKVNDDENEDYPNDR